MPGLSGKELIDGHGQSNADTQADPFDCGAEGVPTDAQAGHPLSAGDAVLHGSLEGVALNRQVGRASVEVALDAAEGIDDRIVHDCAASVACRSDGSTICGVEIAHGKPLEACVVCTKPDGPWSICICCRTSNGGRSCARSRLDGHALVDENRFGVCPRCHTDFIAGHGGGDIDGGLDSGMSRLRCRGRAIGKDLDGTADAETAGLEAAGRIIIRAADEIGNDCHIAGDLTG